MKPVPFKIQKSNTEALKTQVDVGVDFYSRLHYHPEYQMTIILNGKGILYAGNSTSSFEPSDVFLIGSNVPHLFRKTGSEDTILSHTIFFSENSLGHSFFEMDEMAQIANTLEQSQKVLKTKFDNNQKEYQSFLKIPNLKNHELVIAFIQILSCFLDPKSESVNNLVIDHRPTEVESSRLGEVVNFVFENYKREISIPEISQVAALSRSQFSYFFKLHTGKTFIQFLNEVRIENACQMLKNSHNTIEAICYDSGFNNVSNFVRQFKKIKESTPSQYRSFWSKG